MQVYLIDRQDRWCPENNNGQYIIEVWGDGEKAADRANYLDKTETLWYHNVIAYELEDGKVVSDWDEGRPSGAV